MEVSEEHPMQSRITASGRLLFLVAACTALGLAQSGRSAIHHAPPVAKHVPLASRVALPLYFEAHGSSFVASGAGYNLVLDAGQARLGLRGGAATPASEVVITPRNAHPSPKAVTEQPLSGRSNYYIGNDPSKWTTGVPHFGRVRYHDIYNGIDLLYYGAEGKVEFDFVVAPGADPATVELAFQGINGVNVDESGDLLLTTPSGSLRQHKPLAYQDGPNGRTLVAASYVLTDEGTARLDVGSYDRTRPLVIDPILDYASFVGGNGWDWLNDVALDSAGNIYACGGDGSNNFPAGSQLTTPGADPNAYILKLSPDGRDVIYRTYIGGSGDDVDYIHCDVQSDGSAVMTGLSWADDFPQLNSLQPVFGGGDTDIFVARFSPTGEVTFSTYLGGDDYEGPGGMKIDGDDNIYVAGWSASSDFPVVNPIQGQRKGGEDGIILKLTPTGSSLVYSTYYGGFADDWFNEIDVDSTGAAYGTGYTSSSNFPVTPGVFQQFFGGAGDAFALKINPAGSAAVFSTFLGGSDDDESLGLAVDAMGNSYLGGITYSNDFPVMSIQENNAGNGDAFLTKLNATGTGIIQSTYLGGSGEDGVERLAINPWGEAYVAGWTLSDNFPLKNPVQSQRGGNEDGFLLKMNADGSALVYSTYYGGPSDDYPLGIDIDRVGGRIVVGGRTESSAFPTVSPEQANFGGDKDGFLSIYVEAVGTSAASYARGELAPDSIAAVFGNNFATGTMVGPAPPLATSLLDVTVTLTDSEGTDYECGMFFIAGGQTSQINIHIPGDAALGPAVLTVTMADGRKLRAAVEIVSVAPGLFSQNATGVGVAAANVALYSGGAATYELAAKLEGNQWVPNPIPAWGESDQVYLFLYGTGIRNAQNVTATIDGETVGVIGPVAQGEYLALDQMNLGPLPSSLIGRGTVNIVIKMDGKVVNILTVAFAPPAVQ